MSNKNAKVSLMLIMIYLLLSCDSTQEITTINPYYSFEFKYLPSEYTNYNAQLSFYDLDENYISDQNIADLSSDGSQYLDIDVPDNTYYVTIHLFIPNYEDPMYVCGIRFNPDDSSYICHKWFIYKQLSNDKFRYGISDDLIFPLNDDFDFNLNFKDYPYYIFEVESPYDYTYMLTHFYSLGGKISAYTYTKEGISYNSLSNYKYEGGSWAYSKDTNKFYIRVTPENPFISTLAKLKIDINPIIDLNEAVTDMIHISSDNKLIALTKDDNKLYVIDVENSTIEEEVDIGIDNVSDISYSTLYNTIYGVGTGTEGLFSYNLDTQMLNKFSYSVLYPSMLEVDEYNNMLYLFESSLLYRAKLDNLSYLESFSIDNHDYIEEAYFSNDYVFLKDNYSLFQAIRTDEGLIETEIYFSVYNGFNHNEIALDPGLTKVVLFHRYDSLNCYNVENKSLYNHFSDDPESIDSLFFNSTGTHFYTFYSYSNSLVRYNVDDPTDYMRIYVLTESSSDLFVVNEDETKLFGTLTLDNGDDVLYIQDIYVE